MEQLKKKFINKNDLEGDPIKINYGYHRWDPIVGGRCIIHLPWYDKSIWSHLRLKVYPETKNYKIKINGKYCEKVNFKNGYLLVQLPKLTNVHRKITIECMESKQWKLIEFHCDIL
jgi:hypothetical protein